MEKTKKDTMVIYASMIEAIRCLPTYKLRWEAMELLTDYGLYSISPDLDNIDPVLRLFITQAIPNVDSAEKRYYKACNGGAAGGRPAKVVEEDIYEYLMEDYTASEIAEHLGCSERTVRRLIKKINDRANGLNCDET